jgi:hypothetical protein
MFEYFAKIVPCWYRQKNVAHGYMRIEVFWKTDEDGREALIIKAKPVDDDNEYPAHWVPKHITLQRFYDGELGKYYVGDLIEDGIEDGKFETTKELYDYIVEQLDNPQCSYDTYLRYLYIYEMDVERKLYLSHKLPGDDDSEYDE